MISKENYGKDWPTVTLNILRFPSFQSPLVLPKDYRLSVAREIEKWYIKNSESDRLHEMERQHILRLISYLKSVESPHEGASPIAQLQKDFKLFYSQYDQRRNKNFITTFPQLKDWYINL